MTQCEKELYEVWDEYVRKTKELDEKYKSNEMMLDGHMLEYKKLILEADRKAQIIKKMYRNK